jgi:hypothetical protein
MIYATIALALLCVGLLLTLHQERRYRERLQAEPRMERERLLDELRAQAENHRRREDALLGQFAHERGRLLNRIQKPELAVAQQMADELDEEVQLYVPPDDDGAWDEHVRAGG